MNHLCQWPGCGEAIAPKAVFCAEHHFRVRPKDAQFLLRLQLRLVSTQDEAIRRHLREQIPAYARRAIRLANQQKEVESVS